MSSTRVLQLVPPQGLPEVSGLAAPDARDRQAELLDVPYFHVVFTVPSEIEVIAFQNQAVAYDILFQAASETLRKIAAYQSIWRGDRLPRVLHTWDNPSNITRTFIFSFLRASHPMRQLDRLPTRLLSAVTVLSSMFRGLFLLTYEGVRRRALKFFSAHRHLNEPAAFRRYLASVYTDWSSTRSLPSPTAQVLDYVGGILIVSPSPTAVAVDDTAKVRFRYKLPRNRQKTIPLRQTSSAAS